MKRIAGATTTRTIVATLVAAGAVAAGTIVPTAGAVGGCSDLAFANANRVAFKHGGLASSAAQSGMYYTAAADDLVAWRTVRNATPPCSPVLDAVRTHDLRSYADFWRSDNQEAAGNTVNGLAWGKAAMKEADLAMAGIVQYNGA
jgi:hypothetical protein